MLQTIRSFSVIAFSVCAALVLGCGGGGGSGGGGDDGGGGSGSGGSNGGGGASGTSTTSTTASSCDQACSDPFSCPNLVCECNDGTVINTQSCNSGCCEGESAACPGACSDNGGWGS